MTTSAAFKSWPVNYLIRCLVYVEFTNIALSDKPTSKYPAYLKRVGMRSGPECPVCDSTDYVLRDGAFFCLVCNTQSQELGQEKVMDEETVPFDMTGHNTRISIRCLES